MLKGPYVDWHEAVAECWVRKGLMIVGHDWDRGKLYVRTVPLPREAPRFAGERR